MGCTTTVIIHNDQLHLLKEDKKFGEKLAVKILETSTKDEPCESIYCENETIVASPATIIETHHADHIMVVAVGGNSARVLGYGGSYRLMDNTVESKLQILKILADQIGYTLRKKRDR